MSYRTKDKSNTEPHSEQAGVKFEADMYKALILKNSETQNTINTDIDKYEGTDFIVDGLRLDATLFFENKRYMPYCFDTGIEAANGKTFKIGIRIGSKYIEKDENDNTVLDKHGYPKHVYVNFPEPVVVIGLDMGPDEYKQYESQILARMERKSPKFNKDGSPMRDENGQVMTNQPLMDALISLAIAAKKDYITQNKKERKKLDITPLKENEKFKQNRHTAREYQALNYFQHSIMVSKDDTIDDYSYL